MQLSEHELYIVTKILSNLDANIYIFGSRARGTARPDSDLDICLQNTKGEVPIEIIGNLREAFSNSDLTFQVDLVDYFHLSPDFLKNIEKDFKQLHP